MHAAVFFSFFDMFLEMFRRFVCIPLLASTRAHAILVDSRRRSCGLGAKAAGDY